MKTLRKWVPQKYLFQLVEIKNRLGRGYRRTFYSHSGEDIILQQIIHKKDGFYVDIGAFHPKHYSNTYLLFKKGWHGINIDPNRESINFFKRYRPKDINIQAGISDRNDNLTYYCFSEPGCNTFSSETAEKMKKKKWMTYLGEEKIPCVTLVSVLDKYVAPNIHIDLMNIDAEGFDIQILSSNNWDKYTPSVIAVESQTFQPDYPEKDEVYMYLKNKGYTLKAFVGLTLIFKHGKISKN
jgi:FkbM family methyltransferase